MAIDFGGTARVEDAGVYGDVAAGTTAADLAGAGSGQVHLSDRAGPDGQPVDDGRRTMGQHSVALKLWQRSRDQETVVILDAPLRRRGNNSGAVRATPDPLEVARTGQSTQIGVGAAEGKEL